MQLLSKFSRRDLSDALFVEENVFYEGIFGTALGLKVDMRRLQTIGLLLSLIMMSQFEAVYADVLTELRLANESFLNHDFAESQRTHFQYLGVSFTNSSKADSIQVDMNGYFAAGASSMSTLAVNELYFQTDRFQIGRRRYSWSLMEERWHNGIIEPVNRGRPLSPRQQGLTGLFWQQYFENSTLNILVSPLFLPEFGPGYEIQNGEFQSSDPWFQKPPSKVQVFADQDAEPIDYNLIRPSETKVIFQRTIGLQFHGKPEPRHLHDFYWSAAYLYKPNNQFAIAYDGYKSAEELERNRINLEPHVFYHQVASLDMAYRYARNKFGISGLYDVPENNLSLSKDVDWTYPTYKPAVVVSPFVELDLRFFMLGFSRLETFGGEIIEKGDLASPNRASISQKYPYVTANQVSVTSYLRLGKASKLVQSLSYLVGDRGEFEVFKWSPHVHLSSMWHLYAELELISADKPSIKSPNIVYNYADHDRFHLGVGYVF